MGNTIDDTIIKNETSSTSIIKLENGFEASARVTNQIEYVVTPEKGNPYFNSYYASGNSPRRVYLTLEDVYKDVELMFKEAEDDLRNRIANFKKQMKLK